MSILPPIGIFVPPLDRAEPVARLLRLTFTSVYHANIDKKAEKLKIAKQIEATT